ncbi:hypothetical protein LX32DRAFT_168467 [Colletotrichum zoysiae]|uniref:Uncharacterized protein n=1 Tax=Colletotrichum zoysiae TaxID=1216348 RepID=A0AAD9HP50_9PEZI|nr:hypothetical protein LX32DRAFT_168467 [Colletotrichum zoysiae]
MCKDAHFLPNPFCSSLFAFLMSSRGSQDWAVTLPVFLSVSLCLPNSKAVKTKKNHEDGLDALVKRRRCVCVCVCVCACMRARLFPCVIVYPETIKHIPNAKIRSRKLTPRRGAACPASGPL